MVSSYPIRVGARSRGFLRVVFGVRPGRDQVELDDATVLVRFGRFALPVPIEDIVRWRIEGPWRWMTAIGVRRSVRHGDISFAGSPRGGVRLDLRERLRWGPLRLPAVYVGVEDLEGFAAALGRGRGPGRGRPGGLIRAPAWFAPRRADSRPGTPSHLPRHPISPAPAPHLTRPAGQRSRDATCHPPGGACVARASAQGDSRPGQRVARPAVRP